jgi:hypothetical protein
MVSVSALSVGSYTTTLYVMVDILKGVGVLRAPPPPPTLTLLGRKYKHDCLYLLSINSDKHLPQSPFADKFF